MKHAVMIYIRDMVRYPIKADFNIINRLNDKQNLVIFKFKIFLKWYLKLDD